jgi:hypothetical protein
LPVSTSEVEYNFLIVALTCRQTCFAPDSK